MKRRTVLIAGGAVAAAGVLAACGSSDQTPAAASGTPAAADTGAASSVGDALATTAQVPVEGGYVNTEVAVVVTQPAAGEFHAFTAVCPHQGCLVSEVVSNEIICPCHNSRFSAMDGAVISGPAVEGLAQAKVAVEGDRIVLG